METSPNHKDQASRTTPPGPLILDGTNVKAWLKAHTPSFGRLFGSAVNREIHTGEKPDYEPLAEGQIYYVSMVDEDSGQVTQVPHIVESQQELSSLNRKRLAKKNAYIMKCADLKSWLMDNVSLAILTQTAREFSERYHTAIARDDGVTLYHLIVQVARARRDAARQQSPVPSALSQDKQRSPAPPQQTAQRPEPSALQLQAVIQRATVPPQASERQAQAPEVTSRQEQASEKQRPPAAAQPPVSERQLSPVPAQQQIGERQRPPVLNKEQGGERQRSPVAARQVQAVRPPHMQCHKCNKMLEPRDTVQLLCLCLILICEDCARKQLIGNPLTFKSYICCPACKLRVTSEHGMIKGVDAALAEEDRIVRRGFAHTSVSFSEQGVITNFLRLQACLNKLIREVTPARRRWLRVSIFTGITHSTSIAH